MVEGDMLKANGHSSLIGQKRKIDKDKKHSSEEFNTRSSPMDYNLGSDFGEYFFSPDGCFPDLTIQPLNHLFNDPLENLINNQDISLDPQVSYQEPLEPAMSLIEESSDESRLSSPSSPLSMPSLSPPSTLPPSFSSSSSSNSQPSKYQPFALISSSPEKIKLKKIQLAEMHSLPTEERSRDHIDKLSSALTSSDEIDVVDQSLQTSNKKAKTCNKEAAQKASPDNSLKPLRKVKPKAFTLNLRIFQQMFQDAIDSTSEKDIQLALKQFELIKTVKDTYVQYQGTILRNELDSIRLAEKLKTRGYSPDAPHAPTMFRKERKKIADILLKFRSKLSKDQQLKSSMEKQGKSCGSSTPIGKRIYRAELKILLKTTTLKLLDLKERLELSTSQSHSSLLTKEDPSTDKTHTSSSSSLSSSILTPRSMLCASKKVKTTKPSVRIFRNIFNAAFESTSKSFVKAAIIQVESKKGNKDSFTQYKIAILKNKLEGMELEEQLQAVGCPINGESQSPMMFLNERKIIAEKLESLNTDLSVEKLDRASKELSGIRCTASSALGKRITSLEFRITVEETKLKVFNLKEKLELTLQSLHSSVLSQETSSSSSSDCPTTDGLTVGNTLLYQHSMNTTNPLNRTNPRFASGKSKTSAKRTSSKQRK